jgi:hypothetical protein
MFIVLQRCEKIRYHIYNWICVCVCILHTTFIIMQYAICAGFPFLLNLLERNIRKVVLLFTVRSSDLFLLVNWLPLLATSFALQPLCLKPFVLFLFPPNFLHSSVNACSGSVRIIARNPSWLCVRQRHGCQ